ncbi:MAG TPA: branched-chain amino acid ABC transporter permease [Alphaproteobacteria bacterium]|nr:branched-chain amino acid ABC transporter permease [Alphaproteobacteria bacterium]
MTFIQLVLSGLALGAAYALVALGFVFIVNATGAVNFAQGDFVMAGGYAAILLSTSFSVSFYMLLPLVAVVTFLLGVLLAWVAYFPLMRRPPATVFISTLLCGMILQNIFLVAFGPEARSGPSIAGAGMVRFENLEISRQSIATIVVAIGLIALQYLLFARTQTGRRLRATAEDRDMARAVGIPATSLIAVTFGIGTSLAGIAGALLANQFFVSPTGGIPLSVFAYIAVVIGGWGSLAGAVLGSMLISVFQVIVSAYVSYAVATGALYAAVLLIFLLRPQGIFSERVQRRV